MTGACSQWIRSIQKGLRHLSTGFRKSTTSSTTITSRSSCSGIGPLWAAEVGKDIDGDEQRYLLVSSNTWPAEGKEPIDLDDDGVTENEVEEEGEEPLPQLDDEETSEDRREAVRQAGGRRVEEEDEDQQKEAEEQQDEGGAHRNREQELEEKFSRQRRC